MTTVAASPPFSFAGDIVSVDLVVSNKEGLHARPATQIASLVRRSASTVTAVADGESADASAAMSLILLGAETGDRITFTAKGRDASEVLTQILLLFISRFGER